MDWNGGEGSNFRVIRVYVGALSYMMGQISTTTSSTNLQNESGLYGVSGVVWLMMVIILYG